ncbi:HTH-type transcriptional repressor KstR2 [Delftia tsuruhatensis]|uniref:TetR/AcrR family transcriptional regulator n=1 Tax=Delftia tsuruhatensis TaxID=180282 RepID=UPI001E724A7D|nr:TetR/AcrR family transcriptional regulator [Delftia tsuruhatensis]CAB5716927.1 HTH-type transcriptional repressor KstR2 [Delftia tsuruhatensis]CAC9683938.1 HTH-type transcriptional repressor KstR2 [Delftia tsuruhatensis]
MSDSPVSPPAPAEPSGKRSRRKQERPGELLEAALDLFVEKGYAATRVEEVAARAGVSKGTLFLYFASKEELFKAVVRHSIAGRFGEWSEELDNYCAPSTDLLRYCFKTWWERIGNTKASGITKLMLSEAGNFPELSQFYHQEVVLPGHELIRRILQRGVERGEFRPMELDLAVHCVVAPMMFLMIWKHSLGGCLPHGDFDPERFLESQIDYLLHGMCLPVAAPTPPSSPSTP